MKEVRQIASHRRWVVRPLGRAAAVIRAAERGVWPVLDLVIRLWLAQVFFVSGVLKAANWENALNLAANEYPVSWLDPVSAAWLGVSIEIGGAVLLAAGVATRAAALAMLILSLVIQFNYLAFDAHLLWAALFGWYVVFGAGPISLDRSLTRGLADSALPLAAAVLRLTRLISCALGPFYQMVLRLWLAAAMLAAAGFAFTGMMPAEWLTTVLPVKTASHIPPAFLVPGACLLALGLGARLTAVALLVLLSGEMVDAQLYDVWYWMLALALLAVKGPGRLALDAVVGNALKRLMPQLDGGPAFSLEGLPRVVIVGAGFGGLTCAARLAGAPVRVTLIDRHNYHLFQPLLYQVATEDSRRAILRPPCGACSASASTQRCCWAR